VKEADAVTVNDDLGRLAAEPVVYLAYTPVAPGGTGSTLTVVYRGRIRQALSGDWVFTTSTGANGVVGILLGPGLPSWTSSETPGGGVQVDASNPSAQVIIGTVVPTDLLA
jgi:hypothetical protein